MSPPSGAAGLPRPVSCPGLWGLQLYRSEGCPAGSLRLLQPQVFTATPHLFCLPSARPPRPRLLGVVGSGPAPRRFHFRPRKTRFRWLCGMASRQRLRVLCLAGFRQSERGFREKTGALRKALRGRAELVCLSGPHPVPEGAGPDSGETSLLRKCPATYRSLNTADLPVLTQAPACAS